jgi:hypothetical protein
MRLTPHFSLSLGARYDLQTFSKTGVSNPLWSQVGKMPLNGTNFAPRVGIGYSFGNQRPTMVRAGFGIFYTRIPQLYQTAVTNDNGLSDNFHFSRQHGFRPGTSISGLSGCGGQLSARSGFVHHTGGVAVLCDQRGGGVCSELQDTTRAAGQSEPRAGDGRRLHGHRLLSVCAWRGYDPGARCESTRRQLITAIRSSTRLALWFRMNSTTWSRLRPGKRATASVVPIRRVLTRCNVLFRNWEHRPV